MEYYLAHKRMSYASPLMNFGKWNRSVPGQALHGSTSMRYLKESNA
jgi:hypothetical protein